MKVCTDSCIFGAWLANQKLHTENCLDIGTGTGLLTLMYAQKNANCHVDALEIEADACEQAMENFNNSKWKQNLNLVCTDAKSYVTNEKYDLIFSNPPFFENDLLSSEKNKNLAKHNKGLNLDDLLKIIQKHLKQDGHFCLLLPPERAQYFQQLAFQNSFFLNEKVSIKHTSVKNHFREILKFSLLKTTTIENELIIKENDGNYTIDFKELLKDYYLDL